MKKTKAWIMVLVLPAGISLIGLLSIGGAAAGKHGKNSKWFKCSLISDCTVAEGLCGDPTGVNVARLKSFRRWISRHQARIRCAGGIQLIGRALLACENGRCLAGRAPVSTDTQRLSAATNGSCKEISDCTVSRSVCGDPVGIPWAKRKEWEKDVQRREVAVDCAGPISAIKRALLACEKGHCVAGAAPATSSADKPPDKI